MLDAPKLRGATLLWLRGRGLSGVRLVTGDKPLGMLGALEEVFPEARYRRRAVRFCRNVFGKVPRQKRTRVAKMLKAIHAQESREASEAKAAEVANLLEWMKLFAAAKVVRKGCAETLAYTDFPMQHWARIRTNNAIERLNREIRADAGDRQAEIHSRKRVGPQALPRRIAARREGGQDVGR